MPKDKIYIHLYKKKILVQFIFPSALVSEESRAVLTVTWDSTGSVCLGLVGKGGFMIRVQPIGSLSGISKQAHEDWGMVSVDWLQQNPPDEWGGALL